MHLRDLEFQPMEPQPGFLPDDLERFVAAPRIALLAYTKRDGMPAQMPIWYRYRDGRFQMVTATTSAKAKALARAGRASLAIQDEVPPYRAVLVDGDVTLSPAPVEGGIGSELAVRYFGKLAAGEYEKMTREENRKTGLSTITLDPTRVRGFDNHRAIGPALRAYMRLRELLPIPRGWL